MQSPTSRDAAAAGVAQSVASAFEGKDVGVVDVMVSLGTGLAEVGESRPDVPQKPIRVR